MKTLHLVIAAILVLALGTSGTAHGQSAASTASILTVWTDKSNYSANDTVTVAGYVDKSETRFVHKLQVAVSNPNGIWYKQDQFPVDQDGRFSYQFKIEGDLAVGGHYLVRVWSLDESGMDVGTSFNVDSAINSSVVNILVKQGSTELAYSGDNITETIEYNITVEPKFLGSLYVDIFKNSHLLRTDTLGTPDIISFFGTGGQYYYYKLTISGKKDQDVYKINFRYDGKSVEKVIPLTSTRNGIINGTTTNVTPQRAKIDVTFNKKASPIVITGTVYKLFSTIIVLKIQNPQGNLIAVSQLQPAPDGTFSLTLVPSNPLWSMKGNYTVTVASDSQELVKTTFYFNRNASSQTTSNGINTLGLTLSPLKQYETGLAAKDVTCKSDFQLVIKSKDGSPACVKPDTVYILIHRSWAKEVSQTLLHITPIVSSAPCDIPYPQSHAGVAVLYMSPNSTGKICATYHNPDSPTQSSVQVFAAKDMQQMASEITTSAYPDIVPTGNSTIVYDIKTGNQAGLYGMSFFCGSIPFAVGYDNQSRIILDDFPWLYKNDVCLSQTNVFQITGLSGIHVKYVTVAHRG